jgi:hypothetical protein
VVRKLQDRLVMLEMRIDNAIVNGTIKGEKHAWVDFDDIPIDPELVEGLAARYGANGWACKVENSSIQVTL